MRLLISGLTGILVACLIFTAVISMPWHPSPKVLLGVSVGSGDELLRLEGHEGVSYCWPLDPELHRPPSFVMDVTLYEFSKPLGIGSEADLVITVTSKLNVSETFFVAGWIGAHFLESGVTYIPRPDGGRGLPTGGICFVNESSRWVWTGEIDANSSKTFNPRIKAIEVSTVDLEIVVAKMKYEIIGDGIRTAYISWDKEYIFPIEGPHKRIEMTFATFRDNILVRPPGLFYIEKDGVWDYYPPWVKVTMDVIPPGMPPYVLGTEFNLTIGMGQQVPLLSNVTDVTMRLVVPEGIVLVKGETTWTGSFIKKPYTEVQLPMRIRFVKVGTWYMYCYVEKDGMIIGGQGDQVIVSNDDITLTRMF